MGGYDTKEGIREYLKDLAGLNRLATDRARAGYDRREHLRDFCVLGRWITDSCGNFGKITVRDNRFEVVPGDRPFCPDVMTQEEMFKFLGDGSHVGWSPGRNMPRADDLCPECGKGWDIRTCHDSVMSHRDETIPLHGHVGRTVGQVREEFNRRPGEQHMLRRERAVRNDRLIDMRRNPEYATLKMNEFGWMDGDVPDDYVIQEGDEGGFVIFTYRHRSCHQARLNSRELEYFQELFKEAGVEAVLDPIRNEYCDKPNCCGPWFMARNPETGTMKVGWRKNVIHIEIDGLASVDLTEVFTNENVTKASRYVHAWGREKAVKYVSDILCAFRSLKIREVQES